MGHFERAAVAYLQANTLAPSAPEHMSRAGEALAFAADGTVTPRAEKLFTKALRHNPLDARAQYYIGLANFQRGNFQAALKLWVVLEATLENKTKKGEIFVLDMGEPIKISYLAEQLIRLSGLKPEDDIAISYTGLRSGEKIHEELFYEFESKKKTCLLYTSPSPRD